jgi:SAM-dependent methyltransferase
MELSHKRCRCCRSATFERQNLWAEVDPFFARHGLHLNFVHTSEIPLYDWGLRRKIDRLPARLSASLHRRLDRLRSRHLLVSQSIKIAYGFCTTCHYLAPWFEIGEDQLRDYYAYYLKEEYKKARTAFQPGFAELGEIMGSPQEAESRREQHQAYLLPHLLALRATCADEEIRVLDFGGGEGLIIPRLPWIKGSVLDVEVDQANGEDVATTFDLVQCLHVLEHVGDPWRTYQQLLEKCRPGGLIYIEVPIEFPGLDAVNAGKLPVCHEHINKFCLASIEALLRASPVEIVLVEMGTVDFLHLDGQTPVIRGIARKPEAV